MSVITYRKEYKDLKQAYLEVKCFLETETGGEILSLGTQIGNDLGIDGDDSWELLEKFVSKYNLGVSGFEFSKHFLSEGEIAGSDTAFLELIFLPARIVIWL